MASHIVYAGSYDILPDANGIFLAGPTPRSSSVMDGCGGKVKSWRPKAIENLNWLGFEGNVFVPEPNPDIGSWPKYDDQLTWENDFLEYCNCILFWIPRELKYMPGLTTNDEWGYWKNSGKCVLGCPPEAEKVRYQKWWANKLGIPVSDQLHYTCLDAFYLAEHGVHRYILEG